MKALKYRALGPGDEQVLWPLLLLASHESDLEVVKANLELARYVAGWGRGGDFGVGAFTGEECVGAAWCRLWSDGERGYGFLSADVPELAVAVVPEWRGRGVGSSLIEKTLDLAGREYRGVSLSVRTGSPAERLYDRLGFGRVPGSEVVNRAGGISGVMVRWIQSVERGPIGRASR